MSLLNRLEKRFGRFAIPNLTVVLIAGQVLLYFAGMSRGEQALDNIHLLPSKVMQGEVWRLVTFPFTPPAGGILVIFFWLLMYLFGSALEQQWGTFRYNMFLLVGYLANVGAAFVASALGSEVIASNGFLYSTLFLAFARLFPHFVIHVFFILPIEIRWLALIMWLTLGYQVLTGGWMSRMLVVASVLNYLLFFGRDHLMDVRRGRRRRKFEAKAKSPTARLVHKCQVCGLNSETSPKAMFRYCSQCDGQYCYCDQHIRDHTHLDTEGHPRESAPAETEAGS